MYVSLYCNDGNCLILGNVLRLVNRFGFLCVEDRIRTIKDSFSLGREFEKDVNMLRVSILHMVEKLIQQFPVKLVNVAVLLKERYKIIVKFPRGLKFLNALAEIGDIFILFRKFRVIPCAEV